MHGNVHKKTVASRCVDNRFRIESLTSESESNRIVRCQEIPTPNVEVCLQSYCILHLHLVVSTDIVCLFLL